MKTPAKTCGKSGRSRPRDEGGFAMVAVLLVMVVITGLASTSVLRSRMDVAVAANYNAQRTGEVVDDAGLEMMKALITAGGTDGAGNALLANEALPLPISVPATSALAIAWPTKANGTPSDPITFKDADFNLQVTIKYKQEDNINYNATDPYADEVVRYGKDYNYSGARRTIGKQPVYTLSIVGCKREKPSDPNDVCTNPMKVEVDLISSLGFKTPAAIFTKGTVKMYKWGNATQEQIVVTSGTEVPSVPALATTLAKSNANVFIQTVNTKSTPNHDDLDHGAAASPPWGNVTYCWTHFSYTDQTGGTGYYDRPSQYYSNPYTGCTSPLNDPSGTPVRNTANPAQCVYPTCVNCPNAGVDLAPHNTGSHTAHLAGGSNAPASPLLPPWPVGSVGLSAVAALYQYVSDDVYTDTENTNLFNAGQRNQARSQQFILLGVGNPLANLDAAASAGASKLLFNFNKDDNTYVANPTTASPPAVVRYGFVMPLPANLETMMGATFADFLSIADTVCPGAACPSSAGTVPDDFGGTLGATVVDMSGKTFGTSVNDAQIVFFNSNMDINGTYNANPVLSLVTNPNTQMRGAGILVINGDVKVYGSINFNGLMIVRGHLFFRPWQGGNWCNRSDSTLASNWRGYIMVGGNLDLLTLAGGTIILGYGGPGSDASDIKGLISSALERKTLAWRRSYN